VRLIFQKQSALKFVSRTIPRSGGFNTPQLALGVHTRDLVNVKFTQAMVKRKKLKAERATGG
jgi:hypothetical protein